MYTYDSVDISHIEQQSDTLDKMEELFKNNNSSFYNREVEDLCRIPMTSQCD